MPYALNEVCFVADIPLPDGRFGRKLSADARTKLTRDGDTLSVKAQIPGRDYGELETVELDYNWAVVAWSKRAPVEKTASVATLPAKK